MGIEVKSTTRINDAELWLEAGEQFDLAIIDGQYPTGASQNLLNTLKEKELALRVIITHRVHQQLEKLDGSDLIYCNKPLAMNKLWNFLVESQQEEGAVSAVHHDDEVSLDIEDSKVLLAEDNRINQRVMISMLGKLGLSADIAENGLQVIEALEERHYDVILMDMDMPEMDGLTATIKIREMPWKHKQPAIIAMTAYAMESDRQNCLDAGMDEFLSKPFGIRDLKNTLRKVKNLLERAELAK